MQKRSLIGRIARGSAGHPWWTILIWIVVAVSLTTLGGLVTGKDYDKDFTGTVESQQGQELIDQHFGATENAEEAILIRSDAYTVDQPAFREQTSQVIASLDAFTDGARIINYYDAPDNPAMWGMVGDNGHTLLVRIVFAEEPTDYDGRYDDYQAAISSTRNNDFDVQSMGDITAGELDAIIEDDMSKDVSVGMPVAAVVLIVVFGALIAAGVPLVLGALTIISGLGLAELLGGVIFVDPNAQTLLTMIGLAVGIDYSLFLLERYREERRHGALKLDAIEAAASTAGKAVIFSGATVILALSGLVLMPITIFNGMGIATGAAVIIAVLASMTLLPALTRLLGDWINFPRLGLMRKLKHQDATGVVELHDAARGRGVWGHLAAGVMKRPLLAIALAGGFLVLLALPVFTLELGQPSTDSLPDSEYKTAAMMISRYYDAGMEDPFRIVVTGDATSPDVQQRVNAISDAVRADGRFGEPSVDIAPDNQLTVINVSMHEDPYTPAGDDATHDVRTSIVPDAVGDAAHTVYVAGGPAGVSDFNTVLADRLPYVFAFVLGLSFVLLMVAFRSIAVPAVSIVLNLLSVGAAYGAIVAVFQHGWLADLLGLQQVDTVTNWLPVMLFCILFGLSMDYHVFLLSRVREAWDRTGDAELAIVTGVQRTGKIITGAALIMVAVFATFAGGRFVEMQQMGFGLAIAVLLDATLIRTVLVPASLRLLGPKVWAFPRFLHWLPSLNIEGESHAPVSEPVSTLAD